MMRHLSGLLALLLIALVGCSTSPPARNGSPELVTEGYPMFQARLAAGADCPELFEIRNEVRRADPASADRMNEDLRSIGCFSSTSSRTKGEPATESLAVEDDTDESNFATTADPEISTSRQVDESVDNSGQEQECDALGIGEEEVFAELVCSVAPDYEFHPEVVHSFGSGGIDVFIPEDEGRKFQANRAKLTAATQALTEWAKRKYTKFNMVEVTIVSGDVKIAQGQKLGTRDTTVTLY